ncbi:MAG: hypothetical protein ABSD38_15795 [Syntrophorhabdales bacterium]
MRIMGHDYCLGKNMRRSVRMEAKQKEIGISGLIREIADASMKMVRTRVTANSLTDLRNLFFRTDVGGREDEGNRDSSAG